MTDVWILSLHLKYIIFPSASVGSPFSLLTQVLNNRRVILSDRSGIGTELARKPISFSQGGSTGWLKMACLRESQQLAITLTVCLHQSTHVCWPSNMMSLLISCILLMGARGEPYPLSRHFLSCCIVGYVRFLSEDQLLFFKVLLLLLLFFFLLLFHLLLISVCCFPLMVLFALLCHSSSGWKQFHCVCILVMRVLVTISTYLPRYTLNWMYRTFWSTLRFHEQILALCAHIGALVFHLKEWCHCVDKLMISWWLLRENV